MSTPDPAALLRHAAELIEGERTDQHGRPGEFFPRLARLWSAWLTIRRDPAAAFSAADTATMMELLKIVRRECGKVNLEDFTDAAGYAAIAAALALGKDDSD